MPQAIAPIIIAAAGLTGATAAAVHVAAAVATLALTSSYQKKQAADARKAAASAPRDVTIRSAVEPARIIYGKARTSGPVVYTNTQPTPGTNDNSTLWTAISLANHECASIEEIWLDGDQILWSQLSGTGGVTSGKYGPINTNEVTNFYAKLGTPSQTALSELVSAFNDWTTSYTGQDITYIVSAFELGTATGEGVWAQGAPNNIRAVVKGKKVYDPRKDSTNGGSGLHRLADPTTWEWSDNPALCLADYLFDDRLGLGAEGVTYNDIDWSMVADAADDCDATVTTPAGNQKRFTCNGVLSTGATYADNIRTLVSSMNGMLTWTGGKYRIRACAYEAPTYSFTEDDIVGDIQVQPERTRSQRFNTIRGTYIDPESDYNSTEFIPVTNSSYQTTRDGGQKLITDIALPMTNNEYMAQRIAYKALNLNNQQTTAVIPLNWKALKVGVGDRIQVTVSELSWSNKIFLVEGWSFEPDKGFLLNVKEDSSSAYADPSLSDYSTRTLAGTVTFADQPVAAPSGLQATSEEEAILLEWEAPPRGSGYDEVVIYASADSSWANASEVGRTRSTSFRHELARGTTRYYWIRSVDVDGEFSIRDPDSDTSTVTATAGQIATSQLNDDANFALTADWPSVTDSLGTAPEDNATVGSTLGTNTFDTDGSTVMGANELRNSVNKGKTLALLLNKDANGNSNPGEGGLVGVNNVGEPQTGTDGFFVWNGTTYTVDYAQITSGSLEYSFLTGVAGKKGYLAYDISGANFTVLSQSCRAAFVWKEGSTWYYDNNSAAVSFTPTDNMLALAYIETGTADLIQRGGLLAEPVQLLALSEIVADYISAGTIDASVVTVTNLTADNINAGSLSADYISIDGTTIDTDGSGNLIIKDGGVGTTQLGDGAVTADKIGDGEVSIAKFASGITPIQVVDTLPGTADQGDQAFLTTDNKLYRYNGTAWVTAIPLADVTGAGALAALDDIDLTYVTDSGTLAGLSTITETEISDNAVTTNKINANAVTAAKIAAGTITASEIAANTITANEIASNTITANEIAANTITASQIAANTITAGEIQAGAIGATEISVTNLAAISADLGTVTAGSLASSLITGDISTFVTFADTTSQDVIEDDGETVIQSFLLPGNSLGLQPIIIATAYFNYNTGMDQNGTLVFRVRQGQNSTTGTVVSTLIIHTRRQSGVIESGSINIIGVDSEKTADQYYSITVDVDSGNTTDGATFSNVRGVVIGGR